MCLIKDQTPFSLSKQLPLATVSAVDTLNVPFSSWFHFLKSPLSCPARIPRDRTLLPWSPRISAAIVTSLNTCHSNTERPLQTSPWNLCVLLCVCSVCVWLCVYVVCVCELLVYQCCGKDLLSCFRSLILY